MIWNQDAETLPIARRRQLQLERLQALLTWVRDRVPFYRDRLKGSPVRSLDDLVGLPFTRKTDLREHYPFGLFAVAPAELIRIHASSGTKGKAGPWQASRSVSSRAQRSSRGPEAPRSSPVDQPPRPCAMK